MATCRVPGQYLGGFARWRRSSASLSSNSDEAGQVRAEVPSPCDTAKFLLYHKGSKLEEEAVEIIRSCFDQVTPKEVDELLQEYAAKDDKHHHKQEVSTDGLPPSTDEPIETCKVVESEIAHSEADGEDLGNKDLEKMYSFNLKREINANMAEDAKGLHCGWIPLEDLSGSSLHLSSGHGQIMDEHISRDWSDNVPNSSEEIVLGSQSADVEVACSGQCIPSPHAMIQPLQRNWRWFHEQREQREYLAFLEFLLPCLYLHSCKLLALSNSHLTFFSLLLQFFLKLKNLQ